MSRRLLMIAATVALIVGGAAAPAMADGIVDPAPIAPGNPFIGEVNGAASNAVIKVSCLGPVVTQIGHPAAGQSVKALPVTPPVSSLTGYTGTAANEIEVVFGTASGTVTPTILHDWAVSAPIPAGLTFPCSGTGAVAFVPLPTSPTARTYTVNVTFVAVP